uniref:Succinate dehydrogenase subunit 3 n=1 Tax=Oryza glumipatula TaxID=40148 RepID=A0A0D9YLH7_9ORYZ
MSYWSRAVLPSCQSQIHLSPSREFRRRPTSPAAGYPRHAPPPDQASLPQTRSSSSPALSSSTRSRSITATPNLLPSEMLHLLSVFISHNQEFLTFVATILSGALGSSGSSFSSIDSLRRSSTLEQARGYTSRPLGAVRPKMLPSGCRPLHTSHPLSAPVANRPLSPHLPLKKPQLSATFSISHRIFGAALGAAIISIPLATKFSLMGSRVVVPGK